jgi:hypothetical protein
MMSQAMTAPIITIDKIESESKIGAVVICGNSSEFSASYPVDMQAALESPLLTMTSDGERKEAFKRAGLR